MKKEKKERRGEKRETRSRKNKRGGNEKETKRREEQEEEEEGAVGGRDTRVAQRGRSGVLARCTPFQNHPTNSCNAGGKLALPPLYI